ncbi:MAG: tetratricopeptide repeat protein [Leptolyngbyaceae cyanobacterium SM1_3_5]|nr:tetratricopeptide repeat protein [Leptolyngbyaceae cyanobacterium SM1_3_5]
MPELIKCPVCRADYRTSATSSCRRCGADLAPLIEIHDRSIWHYQQAIAAFKSSQIFAAQQQIDFAIALNSRSADFHAFAGQLWALQGKFDRALAAWRSAIAIDADHPIAQTAQQMMYSAWTDS